MNEELTRSRQRKRKKRGKGEGKITPEPRSRRGKWKGKILHYDWPISFFSSWKIGLTNQRSPEDSQQTLSTFFRSFLKPLVSVRSTASCWSSTVPLAIHCCRRKMSQKKGRASGVVAPRRVKDGDVNRADAYMAQQHNTAIFIMIFFYISLAASI